MRSCSPFLNNPLADDVEEKIHGILATETSASYILTDKVKDLLQQDFKLKSYAKNSARIAKVTPSLSQPQRYYDMRKDVLAKVLILLNKAHPSENKLLLLRAKAEEIMLFMSLVHEYQHKQNAVEIFSQCDAKLDDILRDAATLPEVPAEEQTVQAYLTSKDQLISDINVFRLPYCDQVLQGFNAIYTILENTEANLDKAIQSISRKIEQKHAERSQSTTQVNALLGVGSTSSKPPTITSRKRKDFTPSRVPNNSLNVQHAKNNPSFVDGQNSGGHHPSLQFIRHSSSMMYNHTPSQSHTPELSIQERSSSSNSFNSDASTPILVSQTPTPEPTGNINPNKSQSVQLPNPTLNAYQQSVLEQTRHNSDPSRTLRSLSNKPG